MSQAKEKIKGTIRNWESGKLGESAEHMVSASDEEMLVLNKALELKPISIRLQMSLIDKLKIIAQYHGIGYQPLMRDVLNRFVRHELTSIIRELKEQQELEETFSDDDSPAAKFMRNCA